MKLTLAENIRTFRRERKMTQEQLATVLGVTVGAVYKWESGLSVPELDLIVRMADFFDTSVDVLLGHRMLDNRIESTISRLYSFLETLDPAALTEAEKALAKYPHSFEIVYTCASVYLSFGCSAHNPQQLRRALELLEQSRLLFPQNSNPRISEATICGKMAIVYYQLGEQQKSLELMKQNNSDGLYSDEIGSLLAVYMNRPEDAVPFLSEALVTGMSRMLNAILGYVFIYRSRGDWASALDIATLGYEFAVRLIRDGTPGYMDKMLAEVLLVLAYTQEKAGLAAESRESLRKTAELAARFDSTPEYTLRTMRFLENAEHSIVFDTLGATISGSIDYLLGLLDDPGFTDLWKEISNHEQSSR